MFCHLLFCIILYCNTFVVTIEHSGCEPIVFNCKFCIYQDILQYVSPFFPFRIRIKQPPSITYLFGTGKSSGVVLSDTRLLNYTTKAWVNCGLSAFFRMWLFSKIDVGYVPCSYRIITSRSIYPVLEMTKNSQKCKPGLMLLHRVTIAVDQPLRVFVLSILVKGKGNICCLSILCTTRTPAH